MKMESTLDRQIIGLNASHSSEIRMLLQTCGLPSEDSEDHHNRFIGITDGEKLIAVGGLQLFGSAALLRSIAVNSEYRGKGLAAAMTRHLLDLARAQEVTALYLLTDTAKDYFSRFGFRAADRNTLPLKIKASAQFRSLCPPSARAMQLHLQ